MKIITRAVAIKNLKKYIGQDLRKLALEHDITTYETGKQNKGWKGLVLERLAGLQTNVSKAPNGLTYELNLLRFHSKRRTCTKGNNGNNYDQSDRIESPFVF
jgi:DNA mismatch repair protein MutH